MRAASTAKPTAVAHAGIPRNFLLETPSGGAPPALNSGSRSSESRPSGSCDSGMALWRKGGRPKSPVRRHNAIESRKDRTLVRPLRRARTPANAHREVQHTDPAPVLENSVVVRPSSLLGRVEATQPLELTLDPNRRLPAASIR